jgi:ParB family chromosome partitioning protein
VQRSKTPPKGAAVFVAECLARDKFLLDQHHGDETAAELLGLGNDTGTRTGIRELVAGLGTGGDARAQVITLALVLGALEDEHPRTPGAAPPRGVSTSRRLTT